MSIQTKHIPTILLTMALLVSCASSGPKAINLPLSSLEAPKAIVDGSAIAFQASDGTCNKSGFKISPKLSDGKYGPAENIEISSSTFKFKSKSLTQTKFASSTKQLYVKTMAPGEYVVTRIWCYDSNGRTATTYYTKPDRIDIFAEFTVDAGQTNYIGALQVSRSYSVKAPTFRISNKTDSATAFFDKNYADKVAPIQVKLAKRTGPGQSVFGENPRDLAAILKILEDAKAKKEEESAK